MNKRRAKSASLDELLLAYRDAAKIHGAATESGEYKAGNKVFPVLNIVYSELRSRGDDARRALLPLLLDEDPGVRLHAATHALDFAPSEGERVLSSLIHVGRFVGFTAELTLEEWKKGNLRFP